MRAPAAAEFCLVLTPTLDAANRASSAIRERFGILAEETRRNLAAVVAELVTNSVERGPGRPITVTVALGTHSIRGEVSDQGNPAAAPLQIRNRSVSNGSLDLVDRLTSRWAVYEGSTDVWFEMPLVR